MTGVYTLHADGCLLLILMVQVHLDGRVCLELDPPNAGQYKALTESLIFVLSKHWRREHDRASSWHQMAAMIAWLSLACQSQSNRCTQVQDIETKEQNAKAGRKATVEQNACTKEGQ